MAVDRRWHKQFVEPVADGRIVLQPERYKRQTKNGPVFHMTELWCCHR